MTQKTVHNIYRCNAIILFKFSSQALSTFSFSNLLTLQDDRVLTGYNILVNVNSKSKSQIHKGDFFLKTYEKKS